MNQIIQLVTAFTGSLGFAILFNIKKDKLLASSFGGFLVWGVYLLFVNAGVNENISLFLATLSLTFYAELFAKIKKTPTTIFLVAGIIPLIPGGSLYHTMSYAVVGNWKLFVSTGKSTILMACVIAIGMLIGMTCIKTVRVVKDWKENRM